MAQASKLTGSVSFDSKNHQRWTHYLFRYPAKFHPPVASYLLAKYAKGDGLVLDPFCGSGTLLVEAALSGVPVVGLDVDRVAVLISKAKTNRYDAAHLESTANHLLSLLEPLERDESVREKLMFADMTNAELCGRLSNEGLEAPKIPNRAHWFRNYVFYDLARINKAISGIKSPETHKLFLKAVFLAIIRNSSNADPVPVSGLEVTKHMKAKEEEGRMISPVRLFRRKLSRSLDAVKDYVAKVPPGTKVTVHRADIRHASSKLRRSIATVITSPPYLNAVDYYRRHTLEEYWADPSIRHADRVQDKHSYIGRMRVKRKPFDEDKLPPLARHWYKTMMLSSHRRAEAFATYVTEMRGALEEISKLLAFGKSLVLVLGNSSWSGREVPTVDLISEVAQEWFQLTEIESYPLKNRYMSYSRHNGADIRREFIMHLKRKRVGQ